MYFLQGFLSIVLNISTKKHQAQNQTNLKEKILYPAKPEETQDRGSQSSVCLYEVLFG